MKNIIKWMFKSKVDLSSKWWHRFFKVIFIISIAASLVSLIANLSNSYTQVTHQWSHVESLSSRLSKEPYAKKLFSISELYEKNEVISEEMYSYEMTFGLDSKSEALPFNPIFWDKQTKSFCSDELDKFVGNIASTNNINLFSTVDPTFQGLSTDINAFTDYLKKNSYSIKCITLDSYSTSDDNTTLKRPFLRPVDISEYNIYKYENNFLGFILLTILGIALIIFLILCTILIYYKIILYIIYGKVDKNSSE